MQPYDEEETLEIVQRLDRLKTIIRPVIIAVLAIVVGVGVCLIARMADKQGDYTATTLGAFIGLIVGFAIGRFLADLYTVTMDWRSQALILNENILAELKDKTT